MRRRAPRGPRSLSAPFRSVAALAAAVSLAPRAADAAFTRFAAVTEEQGLGNDSVSALAQDDDGAILLGTDAGLYRFDGTEARPFDGANGLPPSAWIRQIAVDEVGRRWVVTSNGVFVRRGGMFAPVDAGHPLDVSSPHVLAFAADRAVLLDGGSLLAAPAGPAGVGRFAPLRPVPAPPPIRFVAPDGVGGFLLGCGMALCTLGGDRLGTIGPADGLPAAAWQIASRAPDGTIWARSLDQLAFRHPGQTRFTAVAVPGGPDRMLLDRPSCLALLPDRHGGVLTQGAAGLLDWSGGSWHVVAHHPDGLPASPVENLLFDREGSLWIGTFGRGAFRSLGFGTWAHWTADDGLPSDIVWNMLRMPDGRLWVATYGATVPLAAPGAGVPGGSEVLAATRTGRLWLAPRDALLRFDPRTNTTDRVSFPGAVASMFVDGQDRLWIAGARGLALIADADGPAAALHPLTVISSPVLQAAPDRSGTVWAVGRAGVFRRGTDGRFTTVIPAAALAGPSDALAFAPDGEMWLASETAGVLRFRFRPDDRVDALPPIGTPTLGSDNVLFLHTDRRGAIWVGTDHGIDLLQAGRWRHFDRSDGLLSDDMNQDAAFEDRDGTLWFGTTRGLMHMLDPAHPPPVAPLHPHIAAILVGARPVPLAFPLAPLRWSARPLVIRFDDLDYTHGNAIGFRYRLDGVDADWNDTDAHEVRYADLPAGHYRFELVAADPVHGSVSPETTFAFRIGAPWWRRDPFFAAVAAAAAVAVATLWRARRRAALRGRERLERIIDARTDEIEQARGELLRLATVDPVTGLGNRQAIADALERAIDAARATGGALAVLLCDIDGFRLVNDALGHDGGDAALAAIGRSLGQAIRSPEAVGRFEGATFCAVLPLPATPPDVAAGTPVGAPVDAPVEAPVAAPLDTPADAATARGTTLRELLASACPDGPGADGRFAVSAGLALWRPADDARALLNRAQGAIARAKAEGGDRLRLDRPGSGDPADAGAAAGAARPGTAGASDPERRRRELVHDLRVALAENEFSLHYQPVVDFARDAVTSCEALIRWQSPRRGRVPPVDFIPLAEEVGLMPRIGDWVLRTACREAVGWPATMRVSVNLSPAQFRLPDLVGRVEHALRVTGLPPERLELEVTETAMIKDTDAAVALLGALRALGIAIALDDFGTGYSSLSFLRTLPFDRIKIDRSFVSDLGTRSQAIVIVRAISGLCASLGASVTAEGVETDAQIEVLRAIGCHELQGYRISRPRPADTLAPWLAGAIPGHARQAMRGAELVT